LESRISRLETADRRTLSQAAIVITAAIRLRVHRVLAAPATAWPAQIGATLQRLAGWAWLLRNGSARARQVR
jgi:hypothetical protein